MYIFLTLFLGSLLVLVFMIGRKVALVQNGHVVENNGRHPLAPDLERIKKITARNGRQYGYLLLVATIRIYVRLMNFLKSKYMQLKTKMVKLKRRSHNAAQNGEPASTQEVSTFLKMISDYKSKIREIKNRISEEEKNK